MSSSAIDPSTGVRCALLHETPLPWQQTAWAQVLQQFQSNTMAHAYLVSGAAGIGKSLFAEAVARAILCASPSPQGACGKCNSCLLGDSGSLPDLLLVAPEEGGRDIKIAQIRHVTDFIAKSSHGGRGKVIVIDSAHSLNNAAANALLKTLEEPSQTTYLFLVTHLPGALSATIRSRCQRIKIESPSAREGAYWLGQQESLSESFAAGLDLAPTQPLLCLKPGGIPDPLALAAVLKGLQSALSTEQALRGLVAAGGKLGELATIGFLEEVSTILIKYLITNVKSPALTLPLENLAEVFLSSGCSRKQVAVRLLAYQQELQDARRKLMSAGNPNPQLVLESMLWRWSKLAS